MPRHSFRDPVTHVLKAHGFVQANDLGDLRQVEADTFVLEPGKWRWNGSQWLSFTPSPRPIQLSGEDVLDLLVSKGLLTRKDVNDAKAAKTL